MKKTILISIDGMRPDGVLQCGNPYVETLKKVLAGVSGNAQKAAAYYHDVVIPAMDAVRAEADTLETLTDKSCWPYPIYSDLLYY